MTHRILLTAYIFLTTYIHEIQSLFSKLYFITDSGVLKELSGVLQCHRKQSVGKQLVSNMGYTGERRYTFSRGQHGRQSQTLKYSYMLIIL